MQGLNSRLIFHGRVIRLSCANLICCLAIGLGLFGCTNDNRLKQPSAIRGVLDLTDWDLKTNGIVNLNGDWDFYWQKLLFPADFAKDPKPVPDDWIPTPAIWNDSTVKGRELSGKGFATYRLLIKLNPEFAKDKQDHFTPPGVKNLTHSDFQLGLLIRYIQSSFTLFVNGVEVGTAGKVGTSAESSIPAYKPQLIRLPVSGDQIELIVQVANYHHRKGGISHMLYLGEYPDVLQKQKNGIITDIFIFSSILVMALYHFGLYILRRKDASTLYFGIFCLSIALRTIVANDSQLLAIFPDIGFRNYLILDYASFTIALPAVVMFFYSLFPEEVNRSVVKWISVLSIVYLLFVLVTPTEIFSESVIPFQLLILFSAVYFLHPLVKAVRNKRSESVYAIIGGLILVAAAVNDILHNNLIIHTAISFQFGVLGMILVQAFLLSVRFSKAFSEVESLKNSLEQKVHERTADLTNALERINQQNQEQKELLHILCHDLANPFVSLSSLLELAQDDISIFEELGKKMYISVDNGLKTIDLVRQMRVLEDKNYSLDVKAENLLELVSESKAILDQRFKDKQLTLVIDIDSNHYVQVEKTSFVNSVLNNIFSNAIKFSMPGEKIVVRSFEENGLVTLSVQDHGIGMSQNLLRDLFDISKSTSRPGTQREKGTGFGMPLIKKFVEAYQGILEIKSIEKKEDSTDHGTEILIGLKTGPEGSEDPSIIT